MSQKSGYYLEGAGAFGWHDEDTDSPCYRDFESFYKKIEDKPFHIGQSYTNKPARRLACIECGATSFEVGMDDWFTAIRCTSCGWEVCIHNG